MTRESNVRFKHIPEPEISLVPRTPASSTEIAVGDLLKESSYTVDIVSAASDNTTFVGLAHDFSGSSETTKIKVVNRCIASIALTSAGYAWGAGLKYTSGSHTADWTLVADSDTDTIAWFYEEGAASGITSGDVLFDIKLQGAVAGSSAFDVASV